MSLNWVEIDRVLEELPLEGAFLQNIKQTSFHHLILEFYRPGRTVNLLICLDKKNMRIHETREKFTSLSKPPRFTSLLRSRIKGCRLEEIRQLGQERIIRMDLVKGEIKHILYVRLWGGAANLVLCTPEGVIQDAFSRRPARKEIPGKSFRPEDLSGSPPARQFALKEEILRLSENYNQGLDLFYRDQESAGDLSEQKSKAYRALDVLESQYESSLAGLRRRLEEYNREEILRERGDILMSSLHLLTRGETSFQTGVADPIPLDPRKSPVENAQDYYKKAGKAARGRAMTREEAELLETKLRGIVEKRKLLDASQDPEEIVSLIPLENAGKSRETEKRQPGLFFHSGGFTLLAGRNSRENDELLRHHVRGNDYWLHTRDYPGGYIFIRTSRNKTVPLEVLLDGGNLAVFYSKAKKSGQADVYYTQVKYLRRPKEGKKGLVLPTKEKNLHITLDETRIKKLREDLA